MVMMYVGHIAAYSLKADSQPRSVGLVWGSAAAWHWRLSAFVKWTGWTLAVTESRWQHHKHCHSLLLLLLLFSTPKRLRGEVFTTRRYTNLRLPLSLPLRYLSFVVIGSNLHSCISNDLTYWYTTVRSLVQLKRSRRPPQQPVAATIARRVFVV